MPCKLRLWAVFWGFGGTIATLICGNPDALTAVACQSVEVKVFHVADAGQPQCLRLLPTMGFRIRGIGDRVSAAGFVF